MKKNILTLLVIACSCINLSAQQMTVDELVDKGIVFHDKGEYISALTYYRQALSADSNSSRALYEMANTYIAMEKYPDAYDYASRVITKNKEYVDHAYTLKGTSLDLMDKPYEALEVYLDGIKAYPDNYLLRYNAALVYLNRKQYADAEYHATKALEIHPSHTSSHLVLAHAAYYQNKRIPCILSLYYFLLLENDSKRSAGALSLLNKQMSGGVTKEGNNINISISGSGLEAEFGAAELVLSASQALKFDEKNKDKTQAALFYDQTQTLFSVLGELGEKKKMKGIWWNMYVPFFKQMTKSGKTEAMCYYISFASQDKEVLDWLDNNKNKIDELASWYEGHISKKK